MSSNMYIPHIAFPLRLDTQGGGLVLQEQGSEEDLMDCAEVLLRTPLGSRQEMPGYGLRPQEFSMGGARKEEILAAVERWEGDRIEAVFGPDPGVLRDLAHTLELRIAGRIHE